MIPVVDVDQVVRLAKLRRVVETGAAREIRERAGLSVQVMATALRVPASTLFRWERGTRRPKSVQALDYLALLERLQETARR